MSEKKSKKLYLKLIGGFVLVDLGLIFTLIFSQVVLGKFMNSGNAQQYIRYYNIGISVVFLLFFIVIDPSKIALPVHWNAKSARYPPKDAFTPSVKASRPL